ncbi:hypothetical protein Tco_0996525 [Tanacetum coccineum]
MESVFHISGHDAAYAMTWEILKEVEDKYCPKGEIKKLEINLWNLTVKETYPKKVDKYISGLLDNILRNVMSARPKTLDDAIKLANDVMDQKLRQLCRKGKLRNKRKSR